MGENNDYEKNSNEIENTSDNNDIFESSFKTEETKAVVGTPDGPPVKSKSREMLEWIVSIAIAIVIALIIRNYVVTFVRVDGSSMVPTLIHNERLFVVRLGYQPKARDIIILNPPSGRGPYVKRIIGMPGQTVKIDNATGNVYVDGEPLNEPYINNKTNSNGGKTEYVVPENCVFVMGDNRGSSHDSRSSDVGFIPFENVLGKVVFRVWPLTKLGLVK